MRVVIVSVIAHTPMIDFVFSFGKKWFEYFDRQNYVELIMGDCKVLFFFSGRVKILYGILILSYGKSNYDPCLDASFSL